MVSVRSGILLFVATTSTCNGFRIPNNSSPATRQRTTGLQLEKDGKGGTTSSSRSSRRDFIRNAAIIVAAGGEFSLSQPAEASYTAFTQREEDWKIREKTGDIKYSNAAALRQQLREIAPMNDEGSKIFCPNGASAAVSPLMENKCGDRQALPSVYGRSDDAMGNSVPGFGGGAAAPQLRAELARESYFRAN